MKKVLFSIVLFCAVCTVYAQKLTVASYNIRLEIDVDDNQGDGWKQRYPIICQLIKFNDFEIFGAQEVKNGQLDDMLSELPEYTYVGVGRNDGLKAGEYSPIFYKKDKFELLKGGTFWLSETPDTPSLGWDAALPRICSWGYFKDKESGRKFWFMNLHMDHIGVEARKESAKLVLKKVKEMCGKDPVILTGDFNVDQNNESYKLLASSEILKDSYEIADIRYALNGTFNNFKSDAFSESRIDHVFVSPSFSVKRYGILTDTYRTKIENEQAEPSANFPREVSLTKYRARVPSDHFPVKVVLEFGAKK